MANAKEYKKSLLLSILDKIQAETDPIKVKSLCIERIETSRIDVNYQRKMIDMFEKTRSGRTTALIYNLILKYEGNGVAAI